MITQVSASEVVAAARGARAEKAEFAVKEIQLQLATQVTVAESTQEQLQRTSR